MCFMQCILMKHSPLAWFHRLTALQLPRKWGGKEWLHLKMLGKQLHIQEVALGKSNDQGKAGFVTFLSLPLFPALSCGSRLCADLGTLVPGVTA